jgi:hypothetical protein
VSSSKEQSSGGHPWPCSKVIKRLQSKILVQLKLLEMIEKEEILLPS